MKTKYKIGSFVSISSDNENYSNYIGKKLKICHVATNESEHKGFDSYIGQALYDLIECESGKYLPFSLYEYELKPF